MEFLGRRVKKDFEGNATYVGTVRSYDSSRGLFKIEYVGGDSEELELSKLINLLCDDDGQADEWLSLGDSASGKGSYFCDIGGLGELDLNASGGLDLNANFNLNEGLDLNCVRSDGLDLNCGVVVIVDDENFNVEDKLGKSREEIIDLNLDVNEDDGENVKEEGDLNERKCHRFDLNLGLDEQSRGLLGGVDVQDQFKESSCEVAGKVSQKEEEVYRGNEAVEVVNIGNSENKQCGVALENDLIESNPVEIELKNNFCNDSFSAGLGSNSDVLGGASKRRRGRKRKLPLDVDTSSAAETKLAESKHVEIELKTSSPNNDSTTGSGLKTDTVSGSVQKTRRGRKRKVVLDTNTSSATNPELIESNLVEIECKISLFNDGSATRFRSNADTAPGSVPTGRRGRKRKVTLDTDTSSATENVLRRSTRRARKFVPLDQDNVSHTVVLSDPVSDLSLSPTASAVTEEKISEVVGLEGSEEQNVLPPKLELPRSSENLNLGVMPVIDVFSVYSFLRSFSSLLFLSPFELEDFVASLNCNGPSLLFDSIHVALLNTLRKHLESLPEDSSQSASHCLRCHNWDLLDMITWPIYMVDYLLSYSFGLKPRFNICCLKLFESDYYEQSPSVKIEILRCLCDDVIEVDSIKSELNKRGLATEPCIDSDRNMKSDNSKRRKAVIDVAGSCVTEDDNDETTDWNSDECCLCKMDGNLICCDGCPAAFHSRCVGVVSNHLPEGDWFCPECMIDKDRPWMKVSKTMRGADLLGTDPYGQLYYTCCGYLLVLEDCHNAASFKYYFRNDLPTVIEVLKSSISVYYTIVSAILKQWDFPSEVDEAKKECGVQEGVPLQFSAYSDMDQKVREVKAEDASFVSAVTGGDISELVDVKSDGVDHAMNLGNQILSSEGSTDVSQPGTNNNETTRFYLRSRHSLVSDRIEAIRKPSVKSTPSAGKSNNATKHGRDLFSIKARIVQPASYTSYVNYYNFAQTASAIADQLSEKSSNKDSEDALKSDEDVLSEQMKAVADRFIEFCWPNISNLYTDARKENCGWCFYCKVPEVERECLLLCSNGTSLENFTSEVLGIRSRKNKKSHLVDVMCHILCIEERLQGLLLGPWLNPQYSKFWRKTLLRVTGIESVKSLLLKLESNLHPLAVSADWTKHVDSAAAVGSAVHIVTTSMRASSRNGIARKRARFPDSETAMTSNAVSGLGLLWWRGGRLSRQLFNWKMLPRAMALKAARQGGCKRIPGILYPEGLEFAKRSKFVSWRAGVEFSKSVEQLALQVRELDTNIRWDDIENNSVSLKLEKESKKPFKSFKKVIVRRKCTEGTVVKYLLDFGKRRFIPDVVLKYGSKVEESSGERKKFWLEESHLPLHLLKAFEQKRLARKSNKLNSGKLQELKRAIYRPPKRMGFSYLFSKAERSENYQCEHCNKDVLIREAVSCQYCKGFFHKRHVRKSAGVITAESTYTCHKCQVRKYFRAGAKKEELKSQKLNKASKQLRPLKSKIRNKPDRNKQSRQIQKNKKVIVVVPLRRSPRKTRCVVLQNKKVKAHKGGKPRKVTNGTSKKQLKCHSQKKRSPRFPLYWLNGLHLSKKPDDDRLLHFKSKSLLVLNGDPTGNVQKPRCSLCCELEFSPMLTYIACECCGDWFHGDALDLKREQIDILVGFKCHACLGKSPPCCPHLGTVRIEAAKLVGLNNCEEMEGIIKDIDERELLGAALVSNRTLKIDDIEQLVSGSVQKAETVEEVCSAYSRHGHQPCELTASNEGTLMQKEAINLGEPPGGVPSDIERNLLSKSSEDLSEKDLSPSMHN